MSNRGKTIGLRGNEHGVVYFGGYLVSIKCLPEEYVYHVVLHVIFGAAAGDLYDFLSPDFYGCH